MKNYHKIHIWEFPLDRTFVSLDDNIKNNLFSKLSEQYSLQKVADMINEHSVKYRLKTNYNSAHVYSWKLGRKSKNRRGQINIPLWVLIELSKIVSLNKNILPLIEKHIISYQGKGKTLAIKKPNLPIKKTPEMISIIFHLCGDGHIGSGKDSSHYRQTNRVGLDNFIRKLENIFGDFKQTIVENSKVIIPRVITDFYKSYFKLKSGWDKVRIPKSVKEMEKPTLLAGLSSFLIDEGHISSDVIEIYSKNKNLINDIKEIGLKLGYIIHGPNEKFRYGKFDSYRIYISVKDAKKLYSDLLKLSKEFPTCNLAHKTELLKQIVDRQNRKSRKTLRGVTKKHILKILENNAETVKELSKILNIGHSSLREHLEMLEKERKVKRVGKRGRSILFKKCT